MEVKQSKILYKFELYLLKIIPMLIAGCNLANTILSYIGIDLPIISYISGIGLIPLIFLYLSSYAFKFCEYHRIFLHYILVNNIISYIDVNYGIPISDRAYIALHAVIVCICFYLIVYLKFKHDVQKVDK